jgi:hypothetical protein
MRHRFSLPLVLVSLLVVAAAGWQARTLAQVRVGSDGRALDSNLMLGSGGYNPRTPTRASSLLDRSLRRPDRPCLPVSGHIPAYLPGRWTAALLSNEQAAEGRAVASPAVVVWRGKLR